MSETRMTSAQMAEQLMLNLSTPAGETQQAQETVDTGVDSVEHSEIGDAVVPEVSEQGVDKNDEVVDSKPEEQPEKVATDLPEADDSFSDWDVSSPDVSNEGPVIDYSSIANDLGLKAADKNEILAQINELKEKAMLAEEASKTINSLPEDLREAIEAAKSGLDYKELLSPAQEFNHSAYSDDALLMEAHAQYFTDANGNVDQESLNEYMDQMTDTQKRIAAKQIRDNLDRINQENRQKKINDAQTQRLQRERELKEAVSSLEDVRGFKVTPSHKQKIMSDVASGKAMQELFYKSDGKTPDMKKVAEAYFLVSNFDKIKSFLVSRAKNDLKKEVFNDVSNSTVRKPVSLPDVKENPKPTAMEEFYASLVPKAKQ